MRMFPHFPGQSQSRRLDTGYRTRRSPLPQPHAGNQKIKTKHMPFRTSVLYRGLEVCLLGWEPVNMPPSLAQPCKGRGGSLSPTCKHHSQPGARIPMRSGRPEPLGRACSQAVTPRLGCTRMCPRPSLITSWALCQSGLG